MATWFTSDWHLDDQTILKWRPEFSSMKEHDVTILDAFKKTVKPKDTVYFGGDIASSHSALAKIQKLKCHKVLILGNHDMDNGIVLMDLLHVYDEIYSTYRLKGYELSHYPIALATDSGNIHGHCHNRAIRSTDKWHMMCNICIDLNNYKMLHMRDVEQIFSQIAKELNQ